MFIIRVMVIVRAVATMVTTGTDCDHHDQGGYCGHYGHVVVTGPMVIVGNVDIIGTVHVSSL